MRKSFVSILGFFYNIVVPGHGNFSTRPYITGRLLMGRKKSNQTRGNF